MSCLFEAAERCSIWTEKTWKSNLAAIAHYYTTTHLETEFSIPTNNFVMSETVSGVIAFHEWVRVIKRRWVRTQKETNRKLVYLQYRAVVKVICAGSALERGEGHISSSERWDVAKLICAPSLLLILSGADEATVDLAVGLLAGAAVILVGSPRPVFTSALVDGKALRTAGVKLQAHIGDVESLA